MLTMTFPQTQRDKDEKVWKWFSSKQDKWGYYEKLNTGLSIVTLPGDKSGTGVIYPL